MGYSIPVKFVAVILAAVALVVVFAAGLGIVQVAELGLYADGFDSWVNNRLQWQAHALAEDVTERYAVRKNSNCSDELLEELGYWYVFEDSIHWTGLSESNYDYTIYDSKGESLVSGMGIPQDRQRFEYQTPMLVQFPVLVTNEQDIEELYGKDYLRRETVYSELYGGKPVTIRYYETPTYTVSISLDTQAMIARSGTSLSLVRMIYEMRYGLMTLMAVSLVLLAACVVYLCYVSGKNSRNAPAKPGGLNRISLDVYAAGGTLGALALASLAVRMINYWIFTMDRLNAGTLMLVGTVILAVALIVVGFVCALSAQMKCTDGYWWRHLALYWLGKGLWWLYRQAASGARKLSRLLPVIWHYLLVGAVIALLLALGVTAQILWRFPWLLIVAGAVSAVTVLYSGYAYGVILYGAEKMAGGDLNSKIDTRYLLGSYGQCAKHLNTLADVAIAAAKKQMQSERMKTELITNVSHDIKTPLTSIINYVDILQANRDAEAAGQYLEVLGRQSQRLKKLIDDLMEMSKAASGNLSVEITTIDPVEAVNQALGEFSDKLEARQLQVVLTHGDEPVSMRADGRLTWRVLSNLLSNIVKYALPGTRVYVDVTCLEQQVLISLKNISREPLNMTAQELTERFVRGDVSRNTEGSGLGLNIAQSLMELQGGQLQLLVDGDLFKATLLFP